MKNIQVMRHWACLIFATNELLDGLISLSPHDRLAHSPGFSLVSSWSGTGISSIQIMPDRQEVSSKTRKILSVVDRTSLPDGFIQNPI